ncbi:MAG: glycosyltransferase family 39 protein [Candidatus Roizmanbacteria bacterium]|nr:glycosyltransferase family 39 protein [Candidatus Roizmanbacteria bacterium]
MKKAKLSALIFILFVFITVFAFVIRIYKVDRAPSGLLVDEASFGYNAYSILKTGKDEHGVLFPLIFKAFGDQKLPAYAYSVVPFIKVFGLNNLAVRLPSVLAGTLLSGVVFLLLIEVGFTLPVSFIGGLITATSPWSVILSRFGFESNFGLLFFMLGFLFTYKSYKNKSILSAIFSGIFFGITLYSYIAFKLITPVLLVGVITLQHFIEKQNKKVSVFIFIAFLLSILPILITAFSSQSTARFTQVGLNYNTGLKMEINEDRAFCGIKLPGLLCYATANKPLFYLRTYLYRYITALSPSYLFLEGDTEYKYLNVDNFGSYYVWLLPFYLLGFFYLWKKASSRLLARFEIILLLGLLICPLPTLLVSGPQKVRISAFFPFILFVILYGVAQIETILKKSWHKYVFFGTIILLSFLSIGYFMIHFLTIHIQKNELSYGTYIPKLMKYLGQQDKNVQIYIRSLPEAVTYFAYENTVDPKSYQENVIFKQPDAIGFAHAKDLMNIHIIEQDMFGIACKARSQKEEALFVSSDNDLSVPIKSKTVFNSENGVNAAAVVYDLKNIIFDYARCPQK